MLDMPVPNRGQLAHVASLRGGAVLETKATLEVVRTRVECVLICSKIANATPCSLPWTQAANFVSKGTIFCRSVSATV